MLEPKWLDQAICQYEMPDSQELCAEIIERLKPSTRWGASQTTGGMQPYSRESDQIPFEENSPAVEHEPVLAFAQQSLNHYLEQLPDAKNQPSFGLVEGYNLLRYQGDGKHGYHAVHSDFGYPSLVHRHLTFTMYLSDIDEGGEIEFPTQGVMVKPRTGRALIFPAFWLYSHRTLPHRTGEERYVFNIFYGFQNQEVAQ
jgi:hypothetical protein